MKKQSLQIGSYFTEKTQPKSRRLPGFTIVELLVVIVVIGILAAISVVAYNGIQNRATDTITKSDVAQAGKQLEIDRVMTGNYPASIGQANEGKGLAQSDSTRYMYTSDGESYELTGYAERNDSKTYCISSTGGTVKEGECPGHGPTAESCFTFDSNTGTITDYSDDAACPRNVRIPETIAGKAVTRIGWQAFYYKYLTGVTIPNSVTVIEFWAFAENKLTSVTIGNSVTSIEDEAFFENQLTSVSIPNSVVNIGHWAFGDNQLTDVTIGNSMTSIGDGVFWSNQLTNVTIPNSVTSIGSGAFDYNPGISCRIPNSAPYDPLNPDIQCATIERY